MTRSLFIAIGVHKAHGLVELDGVLRSVEDMVRWAALSGYDPVVITDDPTLPADERNVTVERIRTALPADVLLDRPRIVVYFCGHGLYAPGDQHWVLSAGPGNRRISAFGFREALETYGPRQIAIFSDACSTPWVQNATADNVVDNYPGDVAGAQKDVFYSTREGAPSFAVPARAGEPAYCVFSYTLSRVLMGPNPDPAALDPLYLETGKRVISSQSLASYLEAQVPAAALEAGKKQRPKCSPGFRPLDNIYVKFAPTPQPPAAPPSHKRVTNFELGGGPGAAKIFSAGPQTPLSAEERNKRRAAFREERQELSRSEWRGPLVHQAAQAIFGMKDRRGLFFVDRSFSLPEPNIDDGLLEAVVGPGQTLHRLSRHGPGLTIVQCGDLYAPVAHYPELWCAMAFRAEADAPDPAKVVRGVNLLSWGSIYATESEHEYRESVEALKGLSDGILTTDDTVRLAHSFRRGKHVDPMLGIVSAYLYTQTGDIDSIRRMAFFYRRHSQAVPFDIALLSRLPLKKEDDTFWIDVPAVSETPEKFREPDAPDFTWCATEATSVAVAGLTPFLRVGWQMMGRSDHAIHRRCAELTSWLSNSVIATIDGHEAGQALRQAFSEFRTDPT